MSATTVLALTTISGHNISLVSPLICQSIKLAPTTIPDTLVIQKVAISWAKNIFLDINACLCLADLILFVSKEDMFGIYQSMPNHHTSTCLGSDVGCADRWGF